MDGQTLKKSDKVWICENGTNIPVEIVDTVKLVYKTKVTKTDDLFKNTVNSESYWEIEAIIAFSNEHIKIKSDTSEFDNVSFYPSYTKHDNYDFNNYNLLDQKGWITT